MSDDQPNDGLGAGGGGYVPPKLSIYESEAPVEWAALRTGENAPDDLLQASPSTDGSPSSSATPASSATPSSSGSPEVLRWSAPQPSYEYPQPEVFVAPANPALKVSGPEKVPKQTTASGKVTRAHATKTKLTGHDAFGGSICTCNLVCTCNQVCTCESVATCSCVSDTSSNTCSCNAVCTCQGVSSCSCQSNQPCSCQAQPY